MPYKNPNDPRRLENAKLAQRRYRAAHPEKVKRQSRHYYERHSARLREDAAAYRSAHPEKVKEWNQANVKRNVAIVAAAKDVPCMDCGGTYPTSVMDFDHRDPSEKSFTISQKRQCGLQMLLAEIAKCDVVCANCHRIRTHGC